MIMDMKAEETQELLVFVIDSMKDGLTNQEIADESDAYAFNKSDLIGVIRQLKHMIELNNKLTSKYPNPIFGPG